MNDYLEVRRGAYHDSVSLMQVSRAAGDAEGVDAAMVAMGTDLNLDLLAGMGFDLAGVDAGPNDLVLALRAGGDDGLARGRAAVDDAIAALAGRRSAPRGLGSEPPPRTVAAAAARAPADLALVSVPGEHAFTEAMDALRAGLNVMVFSDNVAVDAEVALKAEAARRGLLVMGPDCGTAIVGGVGLGFANVTRPGPVGLVAASGTGLQQVCCLLDDAGSGVSHALGVGGRDLSAAVGGASTLAALAALDADDATEVIVVLSKPPAAEVAGRVRAAAATCATPVVLGFVGRGQRDLTAVAAETLAVLGVEAPAPRRWSARGQRSGSYRWVRGLYSGGTLCDEAMVIAAAALGEVRSNIPLEPGWELGGGPGGWLGGGGHVMVDFGDDSLTRGRPHPMIDNGLRREAIAEEARAGDGRVLLLDVVLGHGAHPDPAAELAPALAEALHGAGDAGLAAVVSLCGTAGDPQARDRQAEALRDAGASVHLSNADAARAAVALVTGEEAGR